MTLVTDDTWLISPLLVNLHLPDAFNQSDLQCISGYTFVLSVFMDNPVWIKASAKCINVNVM